MFTPKFVLFAFIVMLGIMYIPAFIHPKSFRKALKGIYTDLNSIRLLSMFPLFLGFIFLSVNWKFSEGWQNIIPAMGWLMIIKGTIQLWFPAYIKKRAKRTILRSDRYVAITAILAVVMGIALGYIALYKLCPIEIIGA